MVLRSRPWTTEREIIEGSDRPDKRMIENQPRGERDCRQLQAPETYPRGNSAGHSLSQCTQSIKRMTCSGTSRSSKAVDVQYIIQCPSSEKKTRS